MIWTLTKIISKQSLIHLQINKNFEIYIYIYIYIYKERSLNIMNYIAEAKAFNIIFENPTWQFSGIYFFVFSLKTKSEYVFWHTPGIVSQIQGPAKYVALVP